MANFRKINQLLNNDNDIDDMIAFINTGRQNYPPNVNNISYLTKSNLFHVNNNKLFYQDNKEVVKKVDANQKVQDLYVDKQSGLGRSQQAHNLQFLQGMTQLNKINNPIHLIFT